MIPPDLHIGPVRSALPRSSACASVPAGLGKCRWQIGALDQPQSPHRFSGRVRVTFPRPRQRQEPGAAATQVATNSGVSRQSDRSALAELDLMVSGPSGPKDQHRATPARAKPADTVRSSHPRSRQPRALLLRRAGPAAEQSRPGRSSRMMSVTSVVARIPESRQRTTCARLVHAADRSKQPGACGVIDAVETCRSAREIGAGR
jgi:hypothetical protein